MHFAEAGTNVPTIKRTVLLAPTRSLQIISTTDANGTQARRDYDPYGRRLLSTITTASNGQGVMTSVTYDGFAPTDSDVVVGAAHDGESFTDLSPSARWRRQRDCTSTVYLDELGRERQTQLALGADYSNETLVVGARTYDGLGRVVFIADPYPISQTAATAYGTTRYFATDSTLRLSVRGNGPQPFTSVPDASVERFPTLLTHSFSNHQEQISVQDAASLTAGTPQNGVVKSSITSAIGRLLARSTWQNGTRIEHAAFAQDRLGNLTTLTRYQDPSGLNGAVQWSWMYDSLGQVLQLLEPSNAPQTRSYSSFGELTQVLWTPPGPEPSHAIVQQFDAFGRLVHREEQNGAVRDAATVADYQYDVGRVASPQVDPTNVLGRLAHAAAPTGEIFYSYDGFGNNNARTFTDQNAKWYVEKSSFHSDDSLASLELDLPDDNYLPERVDYGYDSAGQQRSMLYSDGSSTQALYKANLVDPFGRVRDATYGASTYYATYADTGRRLFKNSVVKALNGIRSVGVGSYDAVGRELSRTEQTRIGKPTTTMTYDALGRLATSVQVNGTTTIGNRSFGYDALGNINDLHDYVGSLGATISYTPTTTDGDHICRISYGNAFGLACNVSYDSFGNVVGEATRTGTRNLAYYNSGDVRRITDTSGAVADFRYGADGALQELDVSSAADTRQDRNYGTLILDALRNRGGRQGHIHVAHVPRRRRDCEPARRGRAVRLRVRRRARRAFHRRPEGHHPPGRRLPAVRRGHLARCPAGYRELHERAVERRRRARAVRPHASRRAHPRPGDWPLPEPRPARRAAHGRDDEPVRVRRQRSGQQRRSDRARLHRGPVRTQRRLCRRLVLRLPGLQHHRPDARFCRSR